MCYQTVQKFIWTRILNQKPLRIVNHPHSSRGIKNLIVQLKGGTTSNPNSQNTIIASLFIFHPTVHLQKAVTQ